MIERHYGILKNIMTKFKKDHSLIEINDVLLVYGIMAKNMLLDVNGVSTLQRVYGTNPVINTLNHEQSPKD